MPGILITKRNLDTFMAKGRLVKAQGEEERLSAKESCVEQIPPSQPSEGSNVSDTVISDF